MATTPQQLIDVIQVKNISTQIVPIFVQRKVDSLITTVYGEIKLQPETSFEAEENRFDLAQIISLQKKNLLSFQRFRRSYAITEEASTGTA